jgi:hypothetical protein
VHTARQLDQSQFAVTIDGKASSREQLLPGWGEHDRLGVVVDEPFGTVGASLLLQLAITAYYDARAERREGRLYPEIYLFHVGAAHGDHGFYDVFPARKEVLVPDDPAVILEAINDRAITRLAVVDGPSEPVRHHLKEPAAALERIVSAFAYSPTGRVAAPDVEIAALDRRAVVNTTIVLHPTRTYAEQQQIRAELRGGASLVTVDEDPAPGRPDEVPVAERDRVAQGRKAISSGGLPSETYRQVSVANALQMLHVRTRPPHPAYC